MRYSFLILAFLMTGVVHAQSAAPVANDDTFITPTDSVLTVQASGVLDNDRDADGDTLAAVLVMQPAHGALTFYRDGSFVYTPNLGFTGTDTFTYFAEEANPERFVIETAQSGVRFEAALDTPVGNDEDSDSSAVAGTITADVTPNAALFTDVHVTALDLTLTDTLSLRFRFGIFGAGGRINVLTEPDSLEMTMVQPGKPTSVTDGAFLQTGNDLSISGTLNLSASGLIGTFIQDGPQDLNAVAQGDLSGTVFQDDTEHLLLLPIQFEGMFEVAGNVVDVTVSGALTARAPVLPPPQQSNMATVTLVVGGVNTATEADADVPTAFVLEANYPNPFNPVTTISYTLPVASEVSLTVYDVMGRAVATLVEARQTAGRHEVAFDASGLPSGVYMYRLQAGEFRAAKTLLVLK